MKKAENIYAFIDSQNLNLSTRTTGWTLDFEKFFIYLKEKYQVNKAFIFLGYVPGNESLYTSLQKMGYIIVFKPTLVRKDGEVKGNVDAELVMHCMIHFNTFSQAIIVTGDGDFHCLVEYLLQKGKLLKLGIPNKEHFSALFRKFAPYHFYVSQLRQRLAYRKKAPPAELGPIPAEVVVQKKPVQQKGRQRNQQKPVQKKPGQQQGNANQQRQGQRRPLQQKQVQNNPNRPQQAPKKQQQPQPVQKKPQQPKQAQGAPGQQQPAQKQQHNRNRRRRRFSGNQRTKREASDGDGTRS